MKTVWDIIKSPVITEKRWLRRRVAGHKAAAQFSG